TDLAGHRYNQRNHPHAADDAVYRKRFEFHYGWGYAADQLLYDYGNHTDRSSYFGRHCRTGHSVDQDAEEEAHRLEEERLYRAADRPVHLWRHRRTDQAQRAEHLLRKSCLCL